MAGEIVGRHEELASVRAFIDGAEPERGALVLEGEPGIGKSTLWLAGIDHAEVRRLRVLSARPTEAERGLAHVGLSDLLDGVLDDVVDELSLPRRRALETVLLRTDGSGPIDHRALAVAVRDALQLLSVQQPIVLAVDDVQWLDVASSSALAFALRRTDAGRVFVLLTRRVLGGAEPSELERALGHLSVDRMRLGPLSVGALHSLLLERFDRPFARQTLLRIHDRSGGNPFFALELARVLDVDVDPLEPLPVPETLEELVRGRLAGLPAATRDALAVASALGSASESLLFRAGASRDALEPAAAAHVIERENGTVRFTHPLLSSVLYADLGGQRRSIHARIADIMDDPLVRARHLALSSDAPDRAVATQVDQAAKLARERGAVAVAAELADHAMRLTPPDTGDERHRRALAAAEMHRAAGEWTRAKKIANELVAQNHAGPRRAESLLLLAELEGLDRAGALLEEALREASSQPALKAVVHCRLAWAQRFKKGFVEALEGARSALELADELDDDALRVEALAMMTFLGSAVGDSDTPAYAARAQELAAAARDPWLIKRANEALVDRYDCSEVGAARALLEREYREVCDRDELSAAKVLGHLAWIELWGWRWERAADYAARAFELKTQYGLEVPWDHLPIAIVAAHRGQLELARRHSERALKLGEDQIGLHTPVHLGTLGVVALQAGDPRTAADWFAEAEAQTTRLGWGDPGHRWWVGDQVEALLELDRTDDAVRVLDVWEADARRLCSDWVLAHVTRCRGLVAATRGDVAHAAVLFEDAVSQHEGAGDPFGRARALLGLGVARRRERQKRAARDAIEAALTAFEQLGAAKWSEKARAELGRIGGRTRAEGLTPAEQRVAALVVEGRTNREVAAALFLGERTVETHLSHVYAKLGVRSRVELARRFRPDEQSSGGIRIPS